MTKIEDETIVEIKSENNSSHFEDANKIISSWPSWKQELAGVSNNNSEASIDLAAEKSNS